MFLDISLGRWRTAAGDTDRKKRRRQWRAPQRGQDAPRRYRARHRPKQVRAGGAPKGPQTPMNVSGHFIGWGSNGRGRYGPLKMAAAMAVPPARAGRPPEIRSPPPAKTGACWGCPKGATNAYECFRPFHWFGVQRTRSIRIAKKGGGSGGPPSAGRTPPGDTEPATGPNRCVLGVPQRGHKRL